jgi:hypothetical protein
MDARSCTETFALTRLRLRAAGSRASVRTWRIVAQLHRFACNAQHGAHRAAWGGRVPMQTRRIVAQLHRELGLMPPEFSPPTKLIAGTGRPAPALRCESTP